MIKLELPKGKQEKLVEEIEAADVETSRELGGQEVLYILNVSCRVKR